MLCDKFTFYKRLVQAFLIILDYYSFNFYCVKKSSSNIKKKKKKKEKL